MSKFKIIIFDAKDHPLHIADKFAHVYVSYNNITRKVINE